MNQLLILGLAGTAAVVAIAANRWRSRRRVPGDTDFAWQRALELEREERLDDAIEALRTQSGDARPYWESQVSRLFELRAIRLWEQGRPDEAREAAEAAIHWMQRYASGASSGSEGLMLQGQVEQLTRRLARIRQP